MEKLIYSIGEVADLLGESTSAVRFWCNSFPKEFNLKRNAKGDRQFRKADIEKLRQIKDMGLRVSLDDFGTGYTSIKQLITLPINLLKIDKTLIDDIERFI